MIINCHDCGKKMHVFKDRKKIILFRCNPCDAVEIFMRRRDKRTIAGIR